MGITTSAPIPAGGQLAHVESGSATAIATAGPGASQGGHERMKSTASERKSKSPENGGQSGSGWSGVTGSFWGWGGGRRTANSTRVAVPD